MLTLGDYVLSQKTGHIGKVIGYGHQILKDGYMPTLKVLVASSADSCKRKFVEEDLHSAWTPWVR
jgi:hypothetical protein